MKPSPQIQKLLAQCASEPIHRLGRSQAFGFLLGFDAARCIVLASANAPDWLGVDAGALLGSTATDWLPASSVEAAEAHARVSAQRGTVQHLHHVAWPGRSEGVDVTLHDSDGLVMIEAEPAGTPVPGSAQAIEACTLELAAARGVAELAESAVRAVARITGHDRVMLYRFSADGSGTVIAEHLSGGQPAYRGLRYPASDIPAQARALYLRNPTRLIADAADPGVPLVCRDGAAPDLSLAMLRTVSPVHLQYMRNMGTAASMSISLIVDGRLWGLIACHHQRPLRPALACRSMVELLGRLYSLAFARAEKTGLDDDIKSLLLSPPGVEPLIAPDAPAELRARACASIARLMDLTGIVVRVDGQTIPWGVVPSDPATWSRSLPIAYAAPVLAIESLQDADPALGHLLPQVAGLLALPLVPDGRDHVLLLRDEVRRHVTWAGNPDKPVDRRGRKLTPRASFEAWRQAVAGHCEPWTAVELELAGVLRARLLDALMARREQRELEGTRRAAEQQTLLVRELNHRVRNMLGLIKGLVQQTAHGAATVEDLAQRLHDRVHALSRAYSQIERAQWKPTPLANLVRDETRAFAEPGQVRCEGDAVQLQPNAYLSFALVIHELATNARKYGALSVPEGRLKVHWEVDGEGTLRLDWTESGGPPVRPPRHRGFGSRVIEQAMSHHLRGRAAMAFRRGGLQARLEAATGFVIDGDGAAERDDAAPRAGPRAVPKRVLVVEDDLVIALLAESLLQRIGCRQVVVTGNAPDALRAIAKGPRFDAAVLDVNLGDHTSEPVAARLAALGVPAVLATGYSEPEQLPEPLRSLRRIFKPYDEAELARALNAG